MTNMVRCHACGASHSAADLFCPRCAAASASAPTTASAEIPAATAPLRDDVLEELQETLTPQIQVLRQLGSGGMGTVYLGRDPGLKRPVAIKVLSPQLAGVESVRRRFEREAQAAAAVAHPNVIGIFQVGTLPRSGASYFVMQFVEGQTLADAFPAGKPAPTHQARRVIGETASALAAAHARGLVHRDIKPANIMVERDTGRTVVLDFGISAIVQREGPGTEPKLTETGMSIGTPTYMSPEQAAAGAASEKSDVYSLGVVAFELLTGRPPFVEASPWALMAAHIKEAPPKVRDLAPDADPLLADLVDRMLLKAPEPRPTAEDVCRALLPERLPVIEWPPPGLERFRGLAHKSAVLFLASGLLSLGYFVDLLSRDASGFAPTPNETVMTLQFRTGPSVTLLVIGMLFTWAAAFYGVKAADGFIRSRRLGYPLRIAAECLLDSHRDTQDALNGLGRFALLAQATRGRLLRRRWLRTALLIGASLATVAGLVAAKERLHAWGLTLEGGPPPIELLALPALLLLGILALQVAEWFSLGVPIWRRHSGKAGVASGVPQWIQARAALGIGRLPAATVSASVVAATALALVIAVNPTLFGAADAIRLRQMASDLQRLADAEDVLRRLTGRYGADLADLGYFVSPGVTVTLMNASDSSWSAVSVANAGGGCRTGLTRPASAAPEERPFGTHVPVTIVCSYTGVPPEPAAR